MCVSTEGRVRRKFQRTTSGSDNKLRKPSAPAANNNNTVTSAPRAPLPQPDNKSSFRGRRLSVREQHKVPLGPRPLDQSKQRWDLHPE
jgi:dual specificity tyrosine-phosphorylation-regulated kinase 2/3/4